MEEIDIKKIPRQLLVGFLPLNDVKVECYHLNNNKRVLSGRGLQKILGINTRENSGKKLVSVSGKTLENLVISFKKNEKCPDEVNDIERVFRQEVIQFVRIGTGGSTPKHTNGFEATFLMDICHFLQDVYLAGILPEKHNELHARATIISRAFAKSGIIAIIDEATGYNKAKDEYRKLFKQFILEEAREWKKEFPDELIDIFYRIYGITKIKNRNHPMFFGKLINKYIYFPLANSNGAILEKLREKNPIIISKTGNKYRKERYFQFLREELGMPELRKHIWKFVGIGSVSKNKTALERNFKRVFPNRDDPVELPIDFEIENSKE